MVRCERPARVGGISGDGIKKDLSLSQLDVRWARVTAENRIPSVANGAVDIECGSTTKTLSRMAQVDFTLLTFLDGGSLIAALYVLNSVPE